MCRQHEKKEKRPHAIMTLVNPILVRIKFLSDIGTSSKTSGGLISSIQVLSKTSVFDKIFLKSVCVSVCVCLSITVHITSFMHTPEQTISFGPDTNHIAV